jgi:hypothetical protein
MIPCRFNIKIFIRLFTIAIVYVGAAKAQGDLVFNSGTRSVFAFTISNSSQSSTAAGEFNEAVSSAVTFSFGSVDADASQFSEVPAIPANSMSGSGLTSRMTILDSPVGTIGGSAVSSFDIFFSVDEDGMYDLNANVGWFGTTLSTGGPTANFASFQLIDNSNGQTLFTLNRDVSLQGTEVLNEVVSLSTGRIYRIRAIARTTGGISIVGSHPANANWSFGISEVSSIPEPSFLVWLAAISPITLFRRNRR